jgi:hypothetical protein
MQMMNRAIEDAQDFRGFMHALQQRNPAAPQAPHADDKAPEPPRVPKRPGENRAQYRARVYGATA